LIKLGRSWHRLNCLGSFIEVTGLATDYEIVEVLMMTSGS